MHVAGAEWKQAVWTPLSAPPSMTARKAAAHHFRVPELRL